MKMTALLYCLGIITGVAISTGASALWQSAKPRWVAVPAFVIGIAVWIWSIALINGWT